MASYNRVILMGNLTRDPEVRFVPSGRAVADLGLAVNEKYKNSEGDFVERTDFFDITVWGPQGENCGKYLEKGRPVLVEGRLRLDTWENDQGEKRSKVKVIADRVQFLGSISRSILSSPSVSVFSLPSTLKRTTLPVPPEP